MKTEAIVASAGIGNRLRGRLRKPYLRLLGKPILIHTLQVLSHSKSINGIIVVVNRLDEERCLRLVKKYGIRKIKAIITGGKERRDSVYKGLGMLDEDTDIVLIHDGVRPFIDDALIKRSINTAGKFGACVVGVPVKATIKKLKAQSSVRSEAKPPRREKLKAVEKTVDRSRLWEIQTPQVFRKDLILKAHERFEKMRATDDSMLVEKLGFKVMAIEGSYNNIKITTSEDLKIAEGILKCA